MDVLEKIQKQVDSAAIVIYMKGTPQFPQCGFSARASQTLASTGVEFAFVNVFEEPEVLHTEEIPQTITEELHMLTELLDMSVRAEDALNASTNPYEMLDEVDGTVSQFEMMVDRIFGAMMKEFDKDKDYDLLEDIQIENSSKKLHEMVASYNRLKKDYSLIEAYKLVVTATQEIVKSFPEIWKRMYETHAHIDRPQTPPRTEQRPEATEEGLGPKAMKVEKIIRKAFELN